MKHVWIALLALAACAPKTPAAVAPTGPCSADPAKSFIGRPYDAALGEAMRKASGAKDIRPLSPGSVATMDFRTDRLNIRLDGNGIVTGVNCG